MLLSASVSDAAGTEAFHSTGGKVRKRLLLGGGFVCGGGGWWSQGLVDSNLLVEVQIRSERCCTCWATAHIPQVAYHAPPPPLKVLVQPPHSE